MARTIISTPNAPAAIGPYSQAVKVGNQVYLSGQIGSRSRSTSPTCLTSVWSMR
ncbi:MAG: hypothetical protein PWP11_1650 [Thauera sp.]|nr:hypothetical protein [Thauera sp.]